MNKIKGYSRYIITPSGLIKNHITGRLRKPFSSNGYRSIKLTSDDGKLGTKLVHRLVWETFKGEIPKGMWINHKDGRKDNNKLSNLELTTPSENHRHAFDILNRTRVHGEKHGSNRLSRVQIEEIRKSFENGVSQSRLAKLCGVSQCMVSKIVNKKKWSN